MPATKASLLDCRPRDYQQVIAGIVIIGIVRAWMAPEQAPFSSSAGAS
tara:strand:- start:6079 stop:6222 length:144 start_codon:yes stop_codon:yes gene_type:complete